MRRAAALLALLLAACGRPSDEECGGETVVALALRGVRDDAATGCAVPPASGWIVPATLPDAPADAGDPPPTFDAEFRQDAGTGALAYCAGHAHEAVLRGTRTGDHLKVETTVPGAVLGACAPTCRPRMTEVVEGDLTRGSGGAPTTFAGTLTETFEGGQGPCGACQLPCTSRYLLTGTAQ